MSKDQKLLSNRFCFLPRNNAKQQVEMIVWSLPHCVCLCSSSWHKSGKTASPHSSLPYLLVALFLAFFGSTEQCVVRWWGGTSGSVVFELPWCLSQKKAKWQTDSTGFLPPTSGLIHRAPDFAVPKFLSWLWLSHLFLPEPTGKDEGGMPPFKSQLKDKRVTS